MIKKISLIVLVLLCFSVSSSSLYVKIDADSSNVKDCLDGKADCPELGEPPVDETELDNESTTQSANNGALILDLIKMGFALAIVLALIYFLLKFLNRRNKLFQQVKTLENMGGIAVGQNKSIQIVRIGSTLYVVGVGENVELLQEITDEEVKEEILSSNNSTDSKQPTFINQLFQNNRSQTGKFKHVFRKELDNLKKNRKELINQQKKKEDEHDGIY